MTSAIEEEVSTELVSTSDTPISVANAVSICVSYSVSNSISTSVSNWISNWVLVSISVSISVSYSNSTSVSISISISTSSTTSSSITSWSIFDISTSPDTVDGSDSTIVVSTIKSLASATSSLGPTVCS